MATDFYGYDREISPNGTVMTSEMAVITFGGSTMGLAQSITGSYKQTIAPAFEIGSPNMAFVAGQPMGSLEITRLCGKEGFLKSFTGVKGSGCGALLDVSINAQSSCASAQVSGGSVRWSSAMASNVSISSNAQGLQVTESISLMCGMMTVD